MENQAVQPASQVTGEGQDPNGPAAPAGRASRWAGAGPRIIVLVGVSAYLSSLDGVFLFDDVGRIVENSAIHSLSNLGPILSGHRPVVDLSLAANYAFGGDNPLGYHLVNAAAHILAGLALYGVVRRSFELVSMGRPIAPFTAVVPLIAAALWVAHPINTQAVTYVIQRSESLMGLFYLLTLYGVLRGAQSDRPWAWYALATTCCAVGMATKAVMITAPVVVLLFDWALVSGSLRGALRRRWAVHLSLLATWSVVWWSGVVGGVLNPDTRHAHVGFGFRGITPIEYALTQCGVLIHYLQLSVWPLPLVLDYQWPKVTSPLGTLPQFGVIAAILGVGFASFLRKRPTALLPVSFLLPLAPTSSFVPIRDVIFEHRMYLAAATVVTAMACGAAVLGGWFQARMGPVGRGIRRTLAATAVIAVVWFVSQTIARNGVYQDEAGMWRDVIFKQPANARAHSGLAQCYFRAGDLEAALAEYEAAARLGPAQSEYHFNLGTCLAELGRTWEAIPAFRAALQREPRHYLASIGLGNALVAAGSMEEAVSEFRKATTLDPGGASGFINLGNSLMRLNRLDEAIAAFRQALVLQPQSGDAHYNLANALSAVGNFGEAADHYRDAIRLDIADVTAYTKLGNALFGAGRMAEAAEAYQQASTREPDNPHLWRNLGSSLGSTGRSVEAIAAFREAIRLAPEYAGAYFNLGNALAQSGAMSAAIDEYQNAVRLDPADAGSFMNLGNACLALERFEEAAAAYETVLALRPGHPRAGQALEFARAQAAARATR